MQLLGKELESTMILLDLMASAEEPVNTLSEGCVGRAYREASQCLSGWDVK